MERFYRLLLGLYSPEFRGSFGEEALADLHADVVEAASRGLAGLFLAAALLLEFGAHGIVDRVGRSVRASTVGEADLGAWGQDLRLALRALIRRPGVLLVSAASLAVGVGATSVVFTVADTLMMRDIPGAVGPDRIVELQLRSASGGAISWDYPDFLDVREQAGLLSHVAAYETSSLSASDEGVGERLLAMYVSSGYFEALGVRMSRGRTFGPEEDSGPGQNTVAIISHATWMARFGGDRNVVGRTLRLNREPYTVVGVVEEGFRGNRFAEQPAVYLPLTQVEMVRKNPELYLGHRGSQWLDVIARLAEGADIEAADAELGAIVARIADEHGSYTRGRTAHALVAGLTPAAARVEMAIALAMMAALMLLVLGTACANVGGMLLARAASRERDMAVRMALGSGRGRLVRLLFSEAMLVFGLGGAGGVLLAVQGVRGFDPNRFLPSSTPIHLDFDLDWRVLLFGMALTFGTGLVFGLLPALRVTRGNLVGTLREQAVGYGVRASRLRRCFVGGQVAVSILLLVTAGLFFTTVRRNARVDPGFNPDDVWVTRLDLSLEGYRDAETAQPLVDRLVAHLRTHPDIASAAVASSVPLEGYSNSTTIWPDGLGSERPWIQSEISSVTEGLFETLGVPVIAGRPFLPEDGRLSRRVAVVNEWFAEHAWPDEDPLGRVVDFGLDSARYTVVGVVGNTQTDRAGDPMGPQVFSLMAQDHRPSVSIVVRAARPTPDFVGLVRRQILDVDPALALDVTRELSEIAEAGLLPQRIAAGIASGLGLLALFLSALGVYGVVAYMVAQRTREIGVRVALGATRAQVLRRVVGGGLALAAPGFIVGLVLAVGLGQVFQSVIVNFHGLDPIAYLAVTLLLLVVTGAASLVPALRASSIAPMDALRQE